MTSYDGAATVGTGQELATASTLLSTVGAQSFIVITSKVPHRSMTLTRNTRRQREEEVAS